MNQKGEVSLLSVMFVMVLSSLVILTTLELKKEYYLLEKRTHLFLCTKEAKGELHHYLLFMGRSNWAIQNLDRASLVMLFIPGLQKASMDAQKTKKYLQRLQNLKSLSYVKNLAGLRRKKCPLDPRMLMTPYQLSSSGLKRDREGSALLRETKWDYHFLSKPYFLTLTIDGSRLNRVQPRPDYLTEEKLGKLSSLLSSR